MRPPVFFLLLAAVAALPIPEDQNELVSRVLKDYYTGFGVGLGVEAMDRFQKEQRSKNQASNTPPQQVRKSGIEQSQQQARDPPANHGPSSYSWYALETDEERQRWDECMRKQKGHHTPGFRAIRFTSKQKRDCYHYAKGLRQPNQNDVAHHDKERGNEKSDFRTATPIAQLSPANSNNVFTSRFDDNKAQSGPMVPAGVKEGLQNGMNVMRNGIELVLAGIGAAKPLLESNLAP